jgi:hypothetical protein
MTNFSARRSLALPGIAIWLRVWYHFYAIELKSSQHVLILPLAAGKIA